MSQTVFLVVVAIILALICLIRLLFALWRYSKWTMLDVILIAIFSVGTQVVAAVFCGGIGSYFSSSYCRLCWVLAVFSALWYLYVFPDKWAPMNISTIFIYIFTFFTMWFCTFAVIDDVQTQKEIQSEIQSAQEYISSGWDVYKDGERINTYEIGFNYDDESIYLIPQK